MRKVGDCFFFQRRWLVDRQRCCQDIANLHTYGGRKLAEPEVGHSMVAESRTYRMMASSGRIGVLLDGKARVIISHVFAVRHPS